MLKNLRTDKLASIFKVDGRPLTLTENQLKIFRLIFHCLYPRNQIIAPTQYGKSLIVALATLLRAVIYPEKFTILAPSEKKAGIIMGYIIDHAFDDPFIVSQLELDKYETLDRLRRERSRNKLTFRGGGGVMTLTLDARNRKRSIEAAIGFGGNRIILDESSLIDDPLYATVKRMVGGYPYNETFLLEIGNPFYRNHFYRTWHSDRYNKIFIDYTIGLGEGRYSPEFIEEMRDEAFFDIFYECKFPEADIIDEKGYRVLLTDEDIEKAFIDSIIEDSEQELYLGVDIAAGGDLNVYALRNHDCAWVESTNRSNDTMTNVTEIERILEEYPELKPENVFIDDIGLGHGVTDRLKEKGLAVNGIAAGEKATDPSRYFNIKAEAYWGVRQWVKAGGKLVRNDKFRQLTWIKYKISTDKVLQIEPKDQLRKRTGKSPDYAEALMLTFAPAQPKPSIRFV